MTTIIKTNKIYDLEERTSNFAKEVVKLCRETPKNSVTIPIISQLVRSGTSIGANYREANGASSKKDFRSKIFICKKESKETKYWLELLNTAVGTGNFSGRRQVLEQEAQELVLIFSKIASSSK